MSGHSFATATTLTEGLINSVPGLKEKFTAAGANMAALPQAWGCQHGCEWIKIFAMPFWVDFTNKVILEDTVNANCERMTGGPGGGGGQGVAGAIEAKRQVQHGRLDVNTIFDKFKLDSFSRPVASMAFDEDLVQELNADKVLQLKSPDKIPPSGFLSTMRSIALQVGAHMAARSAALHAVFLTNGDKKVKQVDIPASILTTDTAVNPAAKRSVSDLFRDILVLGSVQRGVLEIADYAGLMHKTHFHTIFYAPFMTALTTLYRREITEVRTAVEDKDALTRNIATALDQNAFYILGARALAGDATALTSFFTKERARYEEAAKKCGWKPPSAATATPPPTKPSPVGGKRPGAQLGEDGAVDQAATAAGAAATPSKGEAKKAAWKARKKAKKAGATPKKAGKE
jgi:hypothetical protein